jgi:hypothetical protein
MTIPASASPFAGSLTGPARGGTLSQFEGRLLLITPLREITKKSKFPSKDGTGLVRGCEAEVTVLDAETGPYTVHRVQVLSGSMGPQLLPFVNTGKKVVGRLGKDQFDLGVGWVLSDPTEEEIAMAVAYVESHPETSAVGAPKESKDPFTI